MIRIFYSLFKIQRVIMTTTNITNNQIENITNTWKQIFANFIELTMYDNGDIYGMRIFTLLRDSNTCPGIMTELFLKKFKNNLMDNLGELIEPAYNVLFMTIVFENFGDLEIMKTQNKVIQQYLKYICEKAQLPNDFYNYNDFRENTDLFDDDFDKRDYCRFALIATAIQFIYLHKSFIEDIITNTLTPNTFLK